MNAAECRRNYVERAADRDLSTLPGAEGLTMLTGDADVDVLVDPDVRDTLGEVTP